MKVRRDALATPALAAVVLLSGASSCGRLLYDMDTTRSDADTAVDAGPDGAAPDGAAPDAAVDGGMPIAVAVTCSDANPVAPAPPANEVIEPALRIDGLTLLARDRTSIGIVSTSRATPTSADFGAFAPVAGLGDLQDPAFLDLDGVEVAVFSTGTAPRRIFWCQPSVLDEAACQQVTVFMGGTELPGDLDGPAIASLRGRLIMVFNRRDELFVARPRDGERLAWDARPMMLPGGMRADDPALSSDGELLIVPLSAENRLHSMVYHPALDTYVDARLVATPLDAGVSSPSFGRVTTSGHELFGTVATRAQAEPHRLSCTVTRR